jgi:hypothetical protein
MACTVKCLSCGKAAEHSIVPVLDAIHMGRFCQNFTGGDAWVCTFDVAERNSDVRFLRRGGVRQQEVL